MTLRTLWVALLLLPLAGCLGFGDEDDGADKQRDDDCPDVVDPAEGGQTTGTENGTTENATALVISIPDLTMQANETDNTTSEEGMVTDTSHMDEPCPGDVIETPNMAPIPDLGIVMEDGSAFGNNSYILPGQTLTFSARGSSDADGTIGLAGLTVVDANGTRSVSLIQNGTLIDVILKFNHPGVINATLRVIDDRGDAAFVSRMAYVNFQEKGSASAEAYNPNGSGCSGGTGGATAPLIDETFYAKEPFVVTAGATWISVTTSNTRNVSICDPDGKSLGSGATSAETAEAAYPANTQYYLAMHPSGANQTMNYDVIVHFEPKPAA